RPLGVERRAGATRGTGRRDGADFRRGISLRPGALNVPGGTGIMGGPFDPVHNGHLAAARQLRDVAELVEVWLMPNAMPAHRSAAPVASADDRLRMVQLAVDRQPGLLPSALEVDRGGASHPVDTVRAP